ncbi:hydophilic protein [Clavibacter cf. michiganensis LMG 26808]|uniref:Hydophilic protein n=2 Tax=Clavibacter TaxID=1573 RepID=A0A399NP63_9MICO|nr:hydophilic protein [Clavibacter cf. michiganensis LMG 26808]RII95754.1 hydophilic protein [Clavibacter michiganensis]
MVSNVAATPATKCSVCGKANPVGMATGNILDHGRNHERCPGSGKPPAVSTKPASAAAKSGTAPSRKPASDAAKREPSRKTTPAKAAGPTRGVTVRRVEVDTERLRLREEKLERIRVQREEAARRRLGDYIVPLDADGQEAPEADITLETMDDEVQATVEPGASTESDVATADAADGRPSA